MVTKKSKRTSQSTTPAITKNPAELEAKRTVEPTNRQKSLMIVGIGASAGGLNALNSFFDALPSDTGMVFVVVTHLHPEHESHMAEILQKHTQMSIRQVTRKMMVEPDHVYVIPPNCNVILTDTHLVTGEFTEPRGKRNPIDYFFRSMASEHRESLAVILSGGGTDGSVGIKDIKELGGMVMVQQPNDAEYDSMPRAAINTGLADVVLPAYQLAEKLVEYNQHHLQLPHDPGQTAEEQDALVTHLQSEVQSLRKQLQVTIEEYDSSNEEIKATNEELQSFNEEYRSVMEELETSKAELQSVNEELQTVNNDMKNKLEEISHMHQELENILGASEIGTLFLDRDLNIQRFTAGVNGLINIMASDRGRPIGHLTHQLKYDNFTQDAEQVLHSLTPLEQEVQTQTGDWYLLRFRPFRTTQDKIDGVVITFISITELKMSEEELLRTKETLEQHVQERTHELNEANERITQVRDLFFKLFYSNPIPTSLTELKDGTFIDVNDAYLEFAGFSREQVIGHTSLELGLPIANDARSQIVERVQREGMLHNIELHLKHPSGEIATVLASIQLIDIDQTRTLLTSFINITDRVKAEQQIRSLAYNLTTAEQEERQRISQILHDDLQQRIFAVKMQMIALTESYQKNDLQSAQVDFAQLEEWLDDAIAMTRNLSIDLSPAILQGDGLTDALVWLSTQMETQYGLKVNIISNGIAARYEDTLRILLFQAVRELLFNIVKHSKTNEATIVMERTEGHTCITVSDRGVGFDVKALLAGSKTAGGLINLQHRLNLMGCTIQIHSQKVPKGTQAVINIPRDK